jgi:hypothetical protein
MRIRRVGGGGGRGGGRGGAERRDQFDFTLRTIFDINIVE